MAQDDGTQALIATALGRLEVGEVPVPAIGPTQVLVRTAVSGVSAGTERRKLYTADLGPRDVRGDWPAIGAFGYMATGEVVEVGSAVTGIAPGDRVYAGRAWGGHRELIDVEAVSCLPLPDGVDWLVGACAYWAVPPLLGLLAAEPVFYEDAAVVGLGPLGLCGIQLLAPFSRRVVGLDPVSSRRELALGLGATDALDPLHPELADRIHAALPSGPDVVLEVSGTQAGLESALAIVRPKGRVALVGSQQRLSDFDLFWPLQHSGARIVPLHRQGTASPQAGGQDHPMRRYLPDVFEMLLRGRLDIRSLISRVVRPEEAPDAFERLHRHPEEGVGLAIDWRGSPGG
jgi:threonine dehydrogenase-like Zn-dependent dehydrogenase